MASLIYTHFSINDITIFPLGYLPCPASILLSFIHPEVNPYTQLKGSGVTALPIHRLYVAIYVHQIFFIVPLTAFYSDIHSIIILTVEMSLLSSRK